jgi:hypothetical protein
MCFAEDGRRLERKAIVTTRPIGVSGSRIDCVTLISVVPGDILQFPLLENSSEASPPYLVYDLDLPTIKN